MRKISALIFLLFMLVSCDSQLPFVDTKAPTIKPSSTKHISQSNRPLNRAPDDTKKNNVKISVDDSCRMDIDTSICRFVGQNISFTDLKYIPNNLVTITGSHIISKNAQISSEAQIPLREISDAFYHEFKKPLIIVSGYRSYDYQVEIKKRGCPDSFCAKAGYSEHQTGLSVDMFEATTEKEFLEKPVYKQYFEWLKLHAHEYGFTNSYMKGIMIDGYENEPWHWRYLGIDIATKLKNLGISFTEYYYKSNK